MIARLLLVCCLLLSAPSVLAKSRTSVTVLDFTSAPWRTHVVATVAEFTAVMPPRGPRLVYQPLSGACPTRIGKHEIAVCSVWDQPYRGIAPGRFIYLDDADYGAVADYVVCHELMHVLADVGDRYGAYPDSSCVWGWLTAPGSKDVELLRKAYERPKRRMPDDIALPVVGPDGIQGRVMVERDGD